MRTPLLMALTFCVLQARSQRHAKPSPRQLYLAEAGALPRLYGKKDFDSINYYIQLRWPQSGEFVAPDLFAQSILLSIERGIFDGTGISDLSTLDRQIVRELDYYAYVLRLCRRRQPISEPYHTLSRWARDLQCRGQIDSIQRFFCRVYDGEITDPMFWLGRAADTTPQRGLFRYRPTPIRKFGAVVLVGMGPRYHRSLGQQRQSLYRKTRG